MCFTKQKGQIQVSIDFTDSNYYLSILLFFVEYFLAKESDPKLHSILSMDDDNVAKIWGNIFSGQAAVKEECRKILSNPEEVQLLTPVAKARLLYRISQTYWLNDQNLTLDNDELQAEACMKILYSIHSERELIEILRCMNTKGEKMRANEVINNFITLFNALLYQSKQREYVRNWLIRLGSQNIPDLE